MLLLQAQKAVKQCKRQKKGLYGPFGLILTILTAQNGKTKNKVVQNPTLTCYRFTVLTLKYIFWE